jgi:SAM-dependent methyltransferase
MGLTVGSSALVWHDLECGGYTADLELWRELADAQCARREPLLDVGAGSGRVSLDLARRGHLVDALDRDPALLAALAERAVAEGLEVQTICADARSFELERHDYSLCIVPMQTIQLLASARERSELLRGARAHLRPGGLLACAIVTDVEPFDRACGDRAPRPEMARIDGRTYASRPVRVAGDDEALVIERERSIVRAGEATSETDVVRLALVSAAQLEREGRAAGLRPERPRRVSETSEHVGSEVVMLRA